MPRRISTALLSLVAILSFATTSQGIDLYGLVKLPHLGFGGEALGLARDESAVVGQVFNGGGGTQAALWVMVNAAGGWDPTFLPGIGGPGSRADAVIRDGNGRHLVAGSAQDASGVWKPVLWVEQTNGSYTPQVLPTLGGANGAASALISFTFGDPDTVVVAGVSQTALGESHATLWLRSSNGIQFKDLGTLGGMNSRAARADFCGNGSVCVVGSADTLNGQRHAAQWMLDWDHPQIVDQHPGGNSSVWNDFQNPYGAGTARTANGQSLGFFASPLQPLMPLQGLRNSSADGIVPTQYGARIIGVSWDNPNQPLAGIWNHIAPLNRTRGYPVAAVRDLAAQDMGTINLCVIGKRVIAGSGVDSTLPGRPQPVLLIADGAELPDVVAVRLGQPVQQVNETDTWHVGDGNTLGIRSANSDGDRAVIEMSFFGGQALTNHSVDDSRASRRRHRFKRANDGGSVQLLWRSLRPWLRGSSLHTHGHHPMGNFPDVDHCGQSCQCEHRRNPFAIHFRCFNERCPRLRDRRCVSAAALTM